MPTPSGAAPRPQAIRLVDLIRRPVHVAGFAAAAAAGEMDVVSWSRPERLRRAWTALGVSWGLAVAAVFIPVAHVLLVPGLALAGPVVFVRRLRRAAAIRECRGTCPDCGTAQVLPLSGSPRDPMETRCAACHRGLTVRPAPGP